MENIYAGVLALPGTNFQAVRDGRRTPVRHFDVDLTAARSIAAGTQLIVDIASDVFISDVDPVNQGEATVHFQETNLDRVSAPVYVTRGYVVRAPFTSLLIENAAQPGKRLRVFYGVGLDLDPGGNNVTVAGSVSVIDGGKARTLANTAFAGVVTNAGVAAQFSHVQLWNPAGSGKNLILSQITLSSSSAQGVSARSHNVALANLFATNNPQSKLLGGAASSGQLRYESAVGFIPATGDLEAFNIAANTTFPFKLAEPIVIPPGQGLVLFSNSLAVPLTGGFELIEEAV